MAFVPGRNLKERTDMIRVPELLLDYMVHRGSISKEERDFLYEAIRSKRLEDEPADWIQYGVWANRYYCSNCGFHLLGYPVKYCEECGKRMKVNGEIVK